MKQLALPALLALLVHAVALGLHLPWAPPQLRVPENRPVSITLETLRPEPSLEKRAAPAVRPEPKAPAPAKAPVKKSHPAPKPKTAPAPLPAPTPDPAMAAPPPQPVMNQPPTGDKRPPSERTADSPQIAKQLPTAADTSREQPQIQSSVPLYHLNPPPTYPALARRRNYQGVVILDVLVNPQGLAAEVKVARSSGYPILDQSAVRSVSEWRFEPARRGRQAVEMWVKVPVRFALQ